MPNPPRGLADLPALGANDTVTVVIETPKGSANKYAYDPAIAAFRLKAALPAGTVFPFDFGFVPSTRGEDGDPLDVLVFLDSPAPTGCVVETRLIGVIAVRQEQDGAWIANDRILAVAAASQASADLRSIADLRPHLVEEIEAFFRHYVGLQGRRIEIAGRGGPDRAHRVLKAGMASAAASG